MGRYRQRGDEVQVLVALHSRRTRTSDTWAQRSLATSVQAVREDHAALGALARFGTTNWFIKQRIDSLFIPRSIELNKQIIGYLEE